jgi:hypothetical protein
MKEKENTYQEARFAIFICIVVGVAIIISLIGIFVYQHDGTVDLDRSLPRYINASKTE